jgi:hypothetical protein
MSDYLWDKTGEAEPEVERLESLLGQLRHQPRALELPPEVLAELAAPAPRRFRVPVWAAAVLVVWMLSGALLALFYFRADHARSQRLAESVTPPAVPSAGAAQTSQAGVTPPVEDVSQGEGGGRKDTYANDAKRRHTSDFKARAKRGREAAPRTRLDADGGAQVASVRGDSQQVKEQLMYALRLTSAKLNEVQRKTRGEDADAARPAPERKPSR